MYTTSLLGSPGANALSKRAPHCRATLVRAHELVRTSGRSCRHMWGKSQILRIQYHTLIIQSCAISYTSQIRGHEEPEGRRCVRCGALSPCALAGLRCARWRVPERHHSRAPSPSEGFSFQGSWVSALRICAIPCGHGSGDKGLGSLHLHCKVAGLGVRVLRVHPLGFVASPVHVVVGICTRPVFIRVRFSYELDQGFGSEVMR